MLIINLTGISVIWKAVINSISYIRDGLAWRIRSVTSVWVGLDPWTGSGNAYHLPQDLITFLSNAGITHLDHIADLGTPTYSPKLGNQPFKLEFRTYGIMIGLTI